MSNLKRVYPHSFESAKDRGELELYHKNRRLNDDCATAIDAAVSKSNYELYHYDLNSAVQNVCAQFGQKRVEWVLASVVQSHSYDGRYSNEHKAWADTVPVPSDQRYHCNTHPVILDDFIKKVRCLSLKQHTYKHDADYARSHHELDLYRENSKLNRDCAKAIDNAVNEHYDGMHVSRDALRDVTAQFGTERVQAVLATTLLQKEHDGRFSQSNKDWAFVVGIPEKGAGGAFCESHPVKLDELVDHFRNALNERKPSVLGKLQDGKKAMQSAQPKSPTKKSEMEI